MDAQTLFEIGLVVDSVVIAVVGILVTIYMSSANSIDKKIEDKISKPDILKQIAEKTSFTTVVFDENNVIIYKNDPNNILENICVTKDDNGDIEKITIEPNTVISSPPILQTFNTDLIFTEPEKKPQYSWVFYQADSEVYRVVVEKPEEEKSLEKKQSLMKFQITLLK